MVGDGAETVESRVPRRVGRSEASRGGSRRAAVGYCKNFVFQIIRPEAREPISLESISVSGEIHFRRPSRTYRIKYTSSTVPMRMTFSFSFYTYVDRV